MEKSSEEIKKQMLFWFLKYHDKAIDDFDGTERFTLVDKIQVSIRERILEHLKTEINELPIFILYVNEDEWIVNTTTRFVKIDRQKIEYLNYSDFDGHDGFINVAMNGSDEESDMIKTEGNVLDFGFRKKNGEIVYWKIPTGSSGFAFWNVTKKCELIGRKYL